jgi:hypothetical protein
MVCIELDECFIGAHTDNDIDYTTFHMWINGSVAEGGPLVGSNFPAQHRTGCRE